MPNFEWNREVGVFTRECTKCGEVYLGAETQEETEVVLKKYFSRHNYEYGDGFQSRCKKCSNRRQNVLGLGYNEVQRMLESQDYKCAVCEIAVTKSSPVDHDHSTGATRGIVCISCNMGLHYMEPQRTQWRKQAAAYLEASVIKNEKAA